MSEYEEYTESLLYNRGDDQLRKRITQLERQLYRTTQKLEDTRREQERILNDTVVIPPQYIDDSAYVAPVSYQKQEIAPPTVTGATTGESEFDPDAPGAFITGQYKESNDLWISSYPDSGLFPSGVGLNNFDFVNGKVKLYNGIIDSLTGNLNMFRAKYMGGLFFWADQDCDIRFLANGRNTARILYDQCADWSDFDIDFDRLEIKFTFPGNFQLIAQTKSSQVISLLRHLPRMFRFATGTTTNIFGTVNWQATSGSGLLAGTRSSPGTGSTNPVLHVPAILTKSIHVFNLDKVNSMDIQLLGNVDSNSVNFIQDATTGASLTVAAGATKTLQTTTGYQFMVLNVRSTTANAPAIYEIQMMGTGT